jgi:subtilisin family serine protease
MKNFNKILLVTMSLVLLSSCGKSSNDSENSKTKLVPKASFGGDLESESNVEFDIQTQLERVKQAPTITMVLMPKSDLQESIISLKSGGAKLIYDPNNGLGGTIPFYIAELTPDQIGDTEFLSSLKLKAASIDSPETSAKPIETKISSNNLDFTNYIPTDSVGIDKLGDKTKLGEGITVAVIDTGIDASHPAFGDRVVYWYDGTQETRTELTKVNVFQSTITVDLNGEAKKISLSKEITEGREVYAAIMSEKNFTAQLGAKAKEEIGYLDLNRNKSSDDFLVVLTKKGNETKIYFDKTGDLKLVSLDEASEKMAYNSTDKSNRDLGMVSFPTRNNILKYPILLEEEGDKYFVGLGKTEGMHGTHVAGIIAADDQTNNLLGAAPKADLMSIKVCSGISCTDSAIIKGLYKAFYNGKVIPDVVNISLGSHEQYKRDLYSHVMNDLSAKFGTIFFISASNSGPGFRSLNHFGNSGAVVMVGANVSKKTLLDQYNLPIGQETQQENLFSFSSLGPSYTGEMKPNIIAPGAAISAVPAAGGYMAQTNGTSMSSPLAAGAFAAVLAKTKQNNSAYFDNIKSLRAYHLEGSTLAKTSLLPYVFAMRDALQNGAKELTDLTRAQQGYGLIRVGKTQELLETYMSELASGDRDYFEVVLNDYKNGYDRSGEIKEVQSFKLTIGNDGERTKKSLAKIISKGVDVILSRVEVLNNDGSVKVLVGKEAKKFFSIIERGSSEGRLSQTHVSFNNSRSSSFYSKRHMNVMKEGATYLAHYIVKSNEVIVNNILDVVHNAYKLVERKVDVPSIDPRLSTVKKGYSVTNQKIKTNVFHRYPILVDQSINHISVKSALKAGSEGRIFVQFYNPNGKEVKFVVAQNSSVTPYRQAELRVPTAINGKVLTGVWEVTISTASSSWLAPASYDLLVEGHTFGAKKKDATVKSGEDLVIAVTLGGNELNETMITNLREVITEEVTVKTSHISFHPLNIINNYTGSIDLNLIDKNDSYNGSLVSSLFVKKGEEFEKYSGTHRVIGETVVLVKPTTEKLYFALDTFTNYSESDLASKASNSILVEVVTKSSDTIVITATAKEVSQMDLSLVTVDAKNVIEGKVYRADLLLISGEIAEMIDLSGNTIRSISKDSLVNKVELTIK